MLLHKLVVALHCARQAVARRSAGDRAFALDALHLPAPTIHSPVPRGREVLPLMSEAASGFCEVGGNGSEPLVGAGFRA